MLADQGQGAVTTLDLLKSGSTANGPSGSILSQIPTGSGEGNWTSFLCFDSSKGIVSGYNTDAKASPDNPFIKTGENRTTSLLYKNLRSVSHQGTDYIRFSFDFTEPNQASTRFLALNSFQIFASDDGTDRSSFDGPPKDLGTPIFDLDSEGDISVLLNGSLQTKSGASDLELLIPVDAFRGIKAETGILVFSGFGDGTGIEGYPDGYDWAANSGGYSAWRINSSDAVSTVAVPEPSTKALFALGCLGLGWVVRRRP